MRIWVLSIWLLFFLIYTGDAFSQSETSPAETALQRALNHYHAGKLNEAAGLFRGLMISQPDSELVNEAYYYLALIHRDLNEPAMALEYLNRIHDKAMTPEIQLLRAELLLESGDTFRAVDQLMALDTESWPLPLRQKNFLFLATGFMDLNEPHKALYFQSQALVIEGSASPREVLSNIYRLMDSHFSDADLEEAAFMYQNTPVAYLAMLQLGWRNLAAGEKERAQEWASAALAAPIGFAYHEEVLALQSQLSDPSHLQRAIGVLLPLSGRYAAFGERVKKGMELATETFRPEIPVRMIYRDTAGDETRAAQLVAELAISDRVIGIAGPLVGNAAQGAAKRANQEHVALLTMSQRENLAASSLYVFRNSLTAELQVRTLVDYAMEQQGLTQFGIMSPQTRQGQLFAKLFRNEVMQRGGEVVAEESYQIEQTDFRFQVKLLQGLDPNEPDEEDSPSELEKLNEEVEEPTPPPFEALFIPDYADRISLIAPQVAFYGLDEVQLLGTNGWNDAELPKLARQFVEGAVFTDSFFSHSNYPFVQEFVDQFFDRFGEEPTILEAQGYDVAGILLSLLDNYDVNSREDLRKAISQMQNFPGVTGATRFDLTGEAEKILFLLKIQNGNIVQIN